VNSHILGYTMEGSNPIHKTESEKLFQLASDKFGLVHIQELVGKHGVQILSVVDPAGQTLMHIAAKHGRREIIDYLVATNSCSVGCTDLAGNTPFFFAVSSKRKKTCFHLVLNHGVDPRPYLSLAKEVGGNSFYDLLFRAWY